MNVLFLCNDYQFKHFFKVYYEQLLINGYNVETMNLGDGSISQRRSLSNVFKAVWGLQRLRKKFAFDIVVSFGPQAGLISSLYKLGTPFHPVKSITWITGFSWSASTGLSRKIRRLVDKINVHSANVVLTDSNWQKEEVLNEFGMHAEVLWNGSVCGVGPVASDIVFPTTVQRLAVVGRICEAKGILWLLEGLAGTDIEIHFFGPIEFERKGSVDKFRILLEENTGWVYHGYQPFDKIAEKGYILVAPSFREGLPMALLDAQRLGMAVVARNIPGHWEALAGFNRLYTFESIDDLKMRLNELDAVVVPNREISDVTIDRYSAKEVLNAFAKIVRDV